MSARWFGRRLLLVIYTLLVVSVVVFGITQLLPADAATAILGTSATPNALAALRAQLGLNAPAWLQYLHWLDHVLHGNFGVSMTNGQPVAGPMIVALSRSLLLAFLSIMLTLTVAVPLGIVAALRRGGVADILLSLISYLGVSLPEFVTATMLLLIVANELGWLPATGYVPFTTDPVACLRHLVLPTLTVSAVMIAHVSRMVRSEMIEVLHSDYIRAARMKGLEDTTVLLRHALRNALLPVVTIVAMDVGYVLGGIIVVEEIFAIPGIGRQLIVAIQNRDLPAIQAGALIMATTYAVGNFLADCICAALDPRIRYD